MPGSRIGRKIEKSPTNTGFLSTDGSNNNNSYNNTIDSFASNQSLSVGSHSNANNTNSSANSSGNRPTVGTSSNKPLIRSNVCPINAITPYYNAWLIRARVTSKSNLRKYCNARGDGSVFSFDTIDETGEIRVNAFNKECDKFFNLIEVNKVYYITKGMVKTANKKFSTLQNDYEITLNQDSVIELCEESNEPLPQMRFKFVLIKDLENISQQSVIDVIGICKAVDECVTVISKKTNKELKKRDLHLFDKSLCEVRLTLWNEMAEQFDCPINSVIAVKGAMVGEFNGKTLSALNNTTIQIDPEIPETNLLRSNSFVFLLLLLNINIYFSIDYRLVYKRRSKPSNDPFEQIRY
jgi:replication factor A1